MLHHATSCMMPLLSLLKPPTEAISVIARDQKRPGERVRGQGRGAAQRALPLTLHAAPGKVAGAMADDAGQAADFSILQRINADYGGKHLFTANYSTSHLECDPL